MRTSIKRREPKSLQKYFCKFSILVFKLKPIILLYFQMEDK